MRCSRSSHAFSTNAWKAPLLLLFPGETISTIATMRLSERVKNFFKQWEIKFPPASAAAKDAEKTAAAAAAAANASVRPNSP